jgi:hypothetical protein
MCFHTVARIRLKLCEVSLRITESCTGYLLFTCERYARASTARTCAYAHYWTDSLQYWWRHSLGHINVHGKIDVYVCACVCTLCAWVHAHARMCAFAHFWTYSLNKWWKHPSACATYAFYVCTCVCTLCARVYCTHVRAHTLLDGFSPKLMETFLGSQKLARHTWCLRARLRVYTMRVGARTFLNVLAPQLMKTSLSVGYMLFLRAPLHVYTHTFLDGFSPNFMQHSTGHRKLHGLLDFDVCACVCTLCACVHTHSRICAFAHFWTYSFQIWRKHSSA